MDQSQASRLQVVALRKESVDRNRQAFSTKLRVFPSLSARRAWIEIAAIRRAVLSYYVALRKESVDRNSWLVVALLAVGRVALRKESVDRNAAGR